MVFEVCYLSVELGERYTEPMLRVELLATRESAVVDKAPRTCVPGESFDLFIGRYEAVAIGFGEQLLFDLVRHECFVPRYIA